ncbi:exopolysaccharide Pel transporter PelG [Azospirillum picis]|uniref:Membrane protein n=1 Tax=Azospirillum picis TaxID=488438 RepID=A0ABU0MMC6_9PROT|nr:exopolysaccharide Pel transporter PelG [Azospirillum picis]MBP2300618.1 putative membrane protein [Azospirillum picis]MDQ0534587.1 putative membrane protein [Azospirillum picis]
MAGIGFALRRLARRDDLLGILQGYAHSAFITSGPWMFTILALAGINLIGRDLVGMEQLTLFRVVVIYNFGFSVVFTGPLVLVATRYLADAIYAKEVEAAPGMLLATLGLAYAIAAVTAGPFYTLFSGLPLPVMLGGLVNFFLVCGIWVVSIFLSALKDYLAVTVAFGAGMALGMAATVALGGPYGAAGMVWGFSLGLAAIQFGLIARVFAEYPYRVARLFDFLSYFRRYWDLALIGLCANVAVWSDKWIMWFVPEREVVSGAMVIYTAYDSAMFVAYLTTLPALTLFTVNIETRFFEHYQGFYRDIQKHATYDQIARNHRSIISALLDSSRNLLILQGAVCAVGIFLAPAIIGAVGLQYQQVGMFRFGVLGAFFQVLFLFCTVILAYFDLRARNLTVQLVYLAANAGFTLLFSRLGFPWYGYGYFLASLVAFAVAYLMVADAVRRLPYFAFIANNPSIR